VLALVLEHVFHLLEGAEAHVALGISQLVPGHFGECCAVGLGINVLIPNGLHGHRVAEYHT
jgi:hypothetical protein